MSHDSPDAGSKCVKYFFNRQLSIVLDRELSVDFDRPLLFLQNRAPIILNRPISFFGFIHFEIVGKWHKREDQTSLFRIFLKIIIFVEKTSTFLKIGNFPISKNIDFPKNREFRKFRYTCHSRI